MCLSQIKFGIPQITSLRKYFPTEYQDYLNKLKEAQAKFTHAVLYKVQALT